MRLLISNPTTYDLTVRADELERPEDCGEGLDSEGPEKDNVLREIML